MQRKLRILAAAAALFASGCTTYPVVGYFNDYNEVFLGEVNHNLRAGRGYIEVQGENSGVRCSGDSRVRHIPISNAVAGAFLIPYCEGQKGVARLTCDDGRSVRANWTADSCTSGHGYGSDQHGARFEFAFGMPEAQALKLFEAAKEAAKDRETFPIYGSGGSGGGGDSVVAEYSGTGFLVAPGRIVTNHHVVEPGKTLAIWIDGAERPASLVSIDKENDLALLSAEVDGTPLIIPRSPAPAVADEVAALGFPVHYIQGNAMKATFGRINALSGVRDNPAELQMDAPIQGGNSGGPLIDAAGRLVGINTASLSGPDFQNVNYAVKTATLLPLLDGLTLRRSGGYGGFKQAIGAYRDSVFLIIVR